MIPDNPERDAVRNERAVKPAKSWFRRLFSSEHRKSKRKSASGLVAYYWDGAAPIGRQIQNISSTGFYLLTPERWLPGTIITVTLQKTDIAATGEQLYIAVQSKVIRLGEDGVGFGFVQLGRQNSSRMGSSTGRPAGKKALEKFLNQIKSKPGHVTTGAPAATFRGEVFQPGSIWRIRHEQAAR